jgi:hypothetical protein
LLDFYLVDSGEFHTRWRPVLTESWVRRSFAPCRSLASAVIDRTTHPPPPDSVLRHVVRGLPFAREFWQALVGELLICGCDDMPLVQTAPETLGCLLAPPQNPAAPRSAFSPVQQVHFGSRDLRFGLAFYRPDHAGFNGDADVRRLLAYLEGIDPATWHESMLQPLPDFPTADERQEELAFIRDWWPPLVDVYRQAAERGQMVVCEQT